MKSFFAASSVLLVTLLFTASVTAQQASNPPFDFDKHGIEPPEYDWNRETVKTRRDREDRVLKRGLLAPSAQDRQAYESFLRERNTGLIRLMPRELYDWETYRTAKQVSIRGGGAYYSFAHLTHAYGYGSDLGLERNSLRVGFAGADFGILTNLGHVPLDSITRNDPRIRFMVDYKAPSQESAARSEYRRFQKGLAVDGYRYTSSLPVSVNATYILRSINYSQSDVLVAFRVVRKDSDSSIIILWKLLGHYPSPQLARGK
jgi:hypothetical protein